VRHFYDMNDTKHVTVVNICVNIAFTTAIVAINHFIREIC